MAHAAGVCGHTSLSRGTSHHLDSSTRPELCCGCSCAWSGSLNIILNILDFPGWHQGGFATFCCCWAWLPCPVSGGPAWHCLHLHWPLGAAAPMHWDTGPWKYGGQEGSVHLPVCVPQLQRVQVAPQNVLELAASLKIWYLAIFELITQHSWPNTARIDEPCLCVLQMGKGKQNADFWDKILGEKGEAV